jgi:hypothetical protein
MLKGILGLAVIVGIVALILAFIFSVPILTALAILLLVIFGPIIGMLVGVLIPAPVIIKGIVGLTLTVVVIVFGLNYLGVI